MLCDSRPRPARAPETDDDDAGSEGNARDEHVKKFLEKTFDSPKRKMGRVDGGRDPRRTTFADGKESTLIVSFLIKNAFVIAARDARRMYTPNLYLCLGRSETEPDPTLRDAFVRFGLYF